MRNFFGHQNADALLSSAIDNSKIALALNESTIKALSSADSQELNEHMTSLAGIVREVYTNGSDCQEGSFAENVMNEDAAAASQVLANSIVEMGALLNESTATIGNQSVIAATIQTILKQPMEATIFRLFNTKAAVAPIIEIAEMKPTIKFHGSSASQEVYTALEKGTNAYNNLEIIPTKLLTPIALTSNTAKKVDLLQGMDSEYQLNDDLKLVSIVTEVDPDGAGAGAYSATDVKVSMQAGSRPYFEAKYKQMSVVFDVKHLTDLVAEVTVDAVMEKDGKTLKTVTVSVNPIHGTKLARVTGVQFTGTVSHAQHLHPSTLSVETIREELPIPTRPHYEIALTKEDEEDLRKANTGIIGDLATVMATQAVRVANHAEDLRLLKTLGLDYKFTEESNWVASLSTNGNGEITVTMDFEPRAGYNKSSFEYVRESCIPAIDHVVTFLKDKFHLDDSHARVLASPSFIKHITPDANVIKGVVENGPAALSENVSAVSSTNTMILIPSSRVNTWGVKLVIIPNKQENAERRTYDYFRYSSFMTTDLRKASNSALPATVYTLRNAEFVGTNIGANINVKNYIGTTGSKIVQFI